MPTLNVLDKASAMKLFSQRRSRTAVLQLDRESAPYRRSDIYELLSRVIDRASVEAIGQLNNNSTWEIVFCDESTKKRFAAMEVEVKGKRAAVTELHKVTHRIRILHVPTCIPNEFLAFKLNEVGVVVKQIGYDYDRNDGLMSNVRVGVVECKDIDRIPDTMFWRLEDMTGRALIFVQGRAPRCYRCGSRLHKVSQCTAPRSYANASHRGEGDQLEMDDSETEDLHADLGRRSVTEVEESPMEAADVDKERNTMVERSTTDPSAAASTDPPAAGNPPAFTDIPAAVADLAAVANSSVTAASQPSDADDDSEDADAGGETTDHEVDADGFRRPIDHVRRQRRSKRKASVTASYEDAAEMSSKRPSVSDDAAAAADPDPTVLKTSGSVSASADDDPTVRRHSRTRVPSGRSRQTKSSGEERK